MPTIIQPHQAFMPEVAAKKAADLASQDEDGWTYEVEQGDGPLAVVAIYDEDGEFVGYWGGLY